MSQCVGGLLIGRGGADEYVLADVAFEKFDVGLDMLRHISHPVNNDVEGFAFESFGEGRFVSDVAFDDLGVFGDKFSVLSAVEKIQVDSFFDGQFDTAELIIPVPPMNNTFIFFYPISTTTSFSFFILETGIRLPSMGWPLRVIFLTPFWTPLGFTTLMLSVLLRNRRVAVNSFHEAGMQGSMMKAFVIGPDAEDVLRRGVIRPGGGAGQPGDTRCAVARAVNAVGVLGINVWFDAANLGLIVE